MTWRPILWSLAGAAAFLAFTSALRAAEDAGLVSGEVVQRAVQAIIGLGLAAYGNFMPKQIAGMSKSLRAATHAQAAVRVGGWSMTLAGLAYAGLWAFAPLAYADVASMAVVIVGVTVMFGYAAWAFVACRRVKGPAAG